jgi:hypothetical protein
MYVIVICYDHVNMTREAATTPQVRGVSWRLGRVGSRLAWSSSVRSARRRTYSASAWSSRARSSTTPTAPSLFQPNRPEGNNTDPQGN